MLGDEFARFPRRVCLNLKPRTRFCISQQDRAATCSYLLAQSSLDSRGMEKIPVSISDLIPCSLLIDRVHIVPPRTWPHFPRVKLPIMGRVQTPSAGPFRSNFRPIFAEYFYLKGGFHFSALRSRVFYFWQRLGYVSAKCSL